MTNWIEAAEVSERAGVAGWDICAKISQNFGLHFFDSKSKSSPMPADPNASSSNSDAKPAPPKADSPTSENAKTPVNELTPEEQMERFEKELKETDWGHQPC
jgi:hypothetical protein